MNVLRDGTRRWRKARKRGVSPIIATILLVAITVVLAAVLYVLVSGLTRSGASTPYSLGLAVSTATGNSPNFYVYLQLSPTQGLTTSAFGMSVTLTSTSSAQAIAAVPAACKYGVSVATCVSGTGWYALIVGSGNTVVATYGNVTGVWGNYATGTSTLALSGTYQMVIVSNVLYDDSGGHLLTAFGVGASSVSGSAYL